MKSAKELLASGEPLPPGVTPEDLPVAVEGADEDDDLGHGNYIPKTFLRITPYDRPKRRALWIRFEPFVTEGGEYQPHDCDGKFLELRAGREGEDAQLLLKEGDVLTKEKIQSLVDVLLVTKFGFDMDT
jgi:hypothetical protein